MERHIIEDLQETYSPSNLSWGTNDVVIEEDIEDDEVMKKPQRVITTVDLDPYAEIRKVESTTPAGNVTGYAVEVLGVDNQTGEDVWVPTGGTVGPNYLVVPNSAMRDIALEVADKSPWSFKQDTLTFDGKKFMLTMDVEDTDAMAVVDASVGDYIGWGLMFQNGYDGKRAGMVGLYIKQLICSNGAVCTKEFPAYRFRHTPGNEEWQSDVRAALEIVHSAPEKITGFAQKMVALKDTPVNKAFLSNVRLNYASKLGDGLWGKILDRWMLEEENNAFGFLNACTNVLWHQKNLNQSHLRFNDQIVTGLVL